MKLCLNRFLHECFYYKPEQIYLFADWIVPNCLILILPFTILTDDLTLQPVMNREIKISRYEV